MFNPKVTIIIPVYNGSNYLKEAIESALHQTYKNIEILVINDGSTDNSEQIAKQYGDKIKYIHKENGGVSTALNLGISKMTGDYFSWLSHDDRYYPEKIEKQIEYIKNNNLENKKIILYSDYDLMDNHSRVFAKSIKDHNELVKKPEYCLLRGAINGLSLLIPKNAFEECGTFNEDLKCTQDYELWERMQKKYQFVHQPEILVTTRLHREQTGQTSDKVLTEGNKFWIDLINNTTKEKKEQLDGTEYNFYKGMRDFLKTTTPYRETIKFIEDKMKEIEDSNIQKIKQIKVSIIIPFFNRISLVINSLNSALNQTHKNIEIILIDDGSNDSIDPLQKIVKDNENIIKYIKEDKNKGAAHARNIGIKNATGDYIAFLDSDDCFKEKKIEKQLQEMYLRGYKFSHTSYIRDDGKNKQIINTGILHGQAIPTIISNCGIATPTVMIKRDFLVNNNFLYNEKLQIGEDICFYLEILRKTEIMGIQEPLTVVNISNESSAYNPEKQLIGLKTIIKYVINDSELEKYNYNLAVLFREYIRVYDLTHEKKVLEEIEEYNKMQNSTSWKITKPLRLIKNVINLYKHDGPILTTKKIVKKILRILKIIK